MASEASVWLIESPVTMVEGELIAYSVDWQGAAYVSDPEANVYKNGVDITEECMDGEDTHVINGNVLTLKKLQARATDGGARYVLVIEANVDGNLERRKLLIHIVRASEE
jgi:hypothetical protein